MRSAVVVALAALLVSANASGMIALPVTGALGTKCQQNPVAGNTVGFKMFVSVQVVSPAEQYFTLDNKIYAYSSGDCTSTLYATITVKGRITGAAAAAAGTVMGGYNATGYNTTSDIYTVDVAVMEQNATIFIDAFTPAFKSLCPEYTNTTVTVGTPFSVNNGCAKVGLPSITSCPSIHEVAQSYNSGASLIFGPFQNSSAGNPCVAAPSVLIASLVFGDQNTLPEGYTAPPTTAAPTVTPTPTAAAPLAATVSVVAVALAAVFAAFAQRLM